MTSRVVILVGGMAPEGADFRRLQRRSATIVVGAVLAVAMLAGFLVHAYASLRDERVALTRSQATKLLSSFEQHALRQLDYADSYILSIRYFYLKYGDAGLRDYLTQLQGRSNALLITTVTITDANGHVAFRHPDEGNGTDLSGRSYFRHFLADPRDLPYVGETDVGVISRHLGFRVSRPILRDGRFAGEIHVNIQPEYLSDFSGDLALGPHGVATMLNMDRRLIARLPAVNASDYGKVLDQLMIWKQLDLAPSGTFVSPRGLDGASHTFFYKKIDNYPVAINIGYADQDIDADLAQVRRNLIILGLAGSLVTLLVCLLLLHTERKTLSLSLAREASIQTAREMEEINAALTQSNADLEAFAYVASHDLQSPLRNVTSYAQLLKRRFHGQLGSDGDDFIGFIVANALHMSALIKDLLNYARISQDVQPLQAMEAAGSLRQALANLAQPIKDSGATITASGLPVVLIDELQLSSLFQNLIGNAIKYRHPDRPPVITISAESTDTGTWRFAVSDNGIGMEADYLEKIFAIFQRLHTIDQHEGTGIGLALCRRIVNRCGGTIWASSTPGEGSTFSFTLRSG